MLVLLLAAYDCRAGGWLSLGDRICLPLLPNLEVTGASNDPVLHIFALVRSSPV